MKPGPKNPSPEAAQLARDEETRKTLEWIRDLTGKPVIRLVR